jgi:hypothetical protein
MGTFVMAVVPGFQGVFSINYGSNHKREGFRRVFRNNGGGDVNSCVQADNNDPNAFPCRYEPPSTVNLVNEVTPYVEVFRFDRTTINRLGIIEFADLTARTVVLDAPGTKCKFTLGDEAIYSVSSHGLAIPSLPLEVALPTPTHSDVLITLPAHHLSITLEEVDPPLPAATDKSKHGYMHRVGHRTQLVDLTNPIEQEDGKKTVAYTRIFQYDPEPKLSMLFYDSASSSGTAVEPAKPITCASNVKAYDLQLGQSPSFPDGPRAGVTLLDKPSSESAGGATVKVEVSVSHLLEYADGKRESESCPWVEPLNMERDGDNALTVFHESGIGLGLEDLMMLNTDNKFTAEYKEFETMLKRSLPNLGDGASGGLQKCRLPNEELDDEGNLICIPQLTYTETELKSANFGDDHTCTHLANPDQIRNRMPFELLSSDPDNPDAFSASCDTFFASDVTHFRSQAQQFSRFRPWHSLKWTDLDGAERSMWSQVMTEFGDGRDMVELWDTFSGKGWQVFEKGAIDAVHDKNKKSRFDELKDFGNDQIWLTRLGYTAETWGRPWAFLERLLHGERNLLVMPKDEEQGGVEDVREMEKIERDAALEVFQGGTPDQWNSNNDAGNSESYFVTYTNAKCDDSELAKPISATGPDGLIEVGGDN